jgi:hypothetical protein
MEATVTLQPGEGGMGYAASRALRFNPQFCLLAVGGEELVSVDWYALWLY